MTENKKIKLIINGKEKLIPVPLGFELREQNPECNKESKICATLDGNLVCCRIKLSIDEDGDLEIFDLNPCCKNETGKIMEL